ncbi:MAG: DUF512 domain-containing protein [Candidatus Gastranaerophilales bacterium]|nr:DUF512 domain-containing protein [Candidatus Gastranaerophilales bacterium]
MPAIVSKINANSIAEELEIKPGDEILSIDKEIMFDLIDYNFLCKSEFLTIEIKKQNGEIEIIELEKDFDEDLGIVFESAVFDKIKPCLNKCIFCFVDQQPEGLRETLYIKDDDYRLSYLQGTYITLTNLTEKDKERIEKLKLGPFYVSLHTTNPELRIKMLKNPNAGKIMEHLKWLKKNHIPLHLQIVLCPGYNDGDELKRTLSDLKNFKNILSVAIVPVGITKFRKDKLHPVTKKIAQETISIADEFNKTAPFNICCSDEFFALGDKCVPTTKYYGNFSQLEDGVGALRLLLDDFAKEKKRLPKSLSAPKKILIVTSQLAKPAIDEIAQELNKIKNLHADVVAVKSDYWGKNISVAGLITSDDLVSAIVGRAFLPDNTKQKAKGKDLTYNPITLSPYNLFSPLTIIIPSVMLRPFTQDFLDGKTLDYVKQQTGLDFFVIQDCYSTREIVDFVLQN